MSLKIHKICKCGNKEKDHGYDVAGISYCHYCTCRDLTIVAVHDESKNIMTVYTENIPTTDDLKTIEEQYNGRAYQTTPPRQEGNDTMLYATFIKLFKDKKAKPVGKEKKQDDRLF